MGCNGGKEVEKNKREISIDPICRFSLEVPNIYSMATYDDNQILLGTKNELKIFDCTTKTISTLSNEHKGRINCIIKLSNNEIATAGQDKKIKIWNIDEKNSLITLSGHKSMIWCLNEIKDNKLITGASDRTAIIWDLTTKQMDFELFKGEIKEKSDISIALQLKSGNVIICYHDELKLFDIGKKEKIAEKIIPEGVWYILELKNGTVAAGYGNGDIGILEIGNEIKVKNILKGHPKSVNSIIEINDNRIVSASDGNTNNLILWDLNTPDTKLFLEGHNNSVTSLARIRGDKFASASANDKTFKIWE